MARVLGIGGVFFKSPSPKDTIAWYKRVLNFEVTGWGGVMFPPLAEGVTVWTPFPTETKHFAPSSASLMINFVVDDLDGVLAHAAAEGIEPLEVKNDDYGRFAWLMDLDGMKIELWQPSPES